MEAFIDDSNRIIRWRRTFESEKHLKSSSCRMCNNALDCIQTEAMLT